MTKRKMMEPEEAKKHCIDCLSKAQGLSSADQAMTIAGLLNEQDIFGKNELKKILKDIQKNRKIEEQVARRDRRCEINLTDRQLRDVIRDAWAAIHEQNAKEIKVYAGFNSLVRLAVTSVISTESTSRKIEILNINHVHGILIRCANWHVNTNDGLIAAIPPKDVARDLLTYPDPSLPRLESLISFPIFNRLGSLIHEPGYYPKDALFYEPSCGVKFNLIFNVPTPEEIRSAVVLITQDLLGDFPFVSKSDCAHVVAAILVVFVRRMIRGPTPAHVVESPTPGSGKGLIVKIIALLSTGQMPAATSLPSGDGEIRKLITAELSRGPSLIQLDNADENEKLHSPSLAAVLTAEIWTDRILGGSVMASFPNLALWLLTGNNVRLTNELARRAVRARIDPKIDRPWLREAKNFRHKDLVGWTQENLGRLVRAVLVIIQAWIAAGKPAGKKTLGSFESYSSVIGGILEVVGIEGFLSDLDTFYEDADVEGTAWREFVSAWREDGNVVQKEGTSKGTKRTAGQLNDLCTQRDLLPLIRKGGTPASQATLLGLALKNMKGRVFGEYKIEMVDDKGKHGKIYDLIPVEKRSEPGAVLAQPPPEGPLANFTEIINACSTFGGVGDVSPIIEKSFSKTLISSLEFSAGSTRPVPLASPTSSEAEISPRIDEQILLGTFLGSHPQSPHAGNSEPWSDHEI